LATETWKLIDSLATQTSSRNLLSVNIAYTSVGVAANSRWLEMFMAAGGDPPVLSGGSVTLPLAGRDLAVGGHLFQAS
jgi:hypothetical protein